MVIRITNQPEWKEGEVVVLRVGGSLVWLGLVWLGLVWLGLAWFHFRRLE